MSRHETPWEDFQFFYLAELTRQKIKPLSRWEKPLSARSRKWLKSRGLKTEIIPRKTMSGKSIFETVFSTSSHYLSFYRKKFGSQPLNFRPETQRREGFLFGYPSCCVQQFIQKPYQKNDLPAETQQKLFHWVCAECRLTPELLPYYLPVHRETLAWYNHEFKIGIPAGKKFAGRWQLAAGMALWLSAASVSSQVIPDSSHYIPVPHDTDQDYLSDAEEVYLGTNFMSSYTLPGVTDNIYWTGFFKAIIDSLPTSPQTDRPYREDWLALGHETCWFCGMDINMGFVRIINPRRNLSIDIPYMGLHFMGNHCFSYHGSTHSGRVDLDLLKKILYPFQISHMLPVTGDRDQDGLTDAEEDSLYFDPGNRDTNGDSLPDGAEVAEQLTRLLPLLPAQSDSMHSWIRYQPMYGIENCTVCGATHNMGYIEIHNPENQRTFQIHFNGLHALAHGSFAYDGTTWPNQRAAAVDLYRTMKTHQLFIPGDTDRDGLKDLEEPRFGYDPNMADSDGDGIGDGMDLALTMKSLLDNLPTAPPGNGPWVDHYLTFGHWNCLICGEAVNMGYLEIWHPLINGPFTMSYYAYHFLTRGSFAYEGRIENGQWIEGRIDPLLLAPYLDLVVGLEAGKPPAFTGTFELLPNFPNPFNSSTQILFRLHYHGKIKVDICDITGKQVRTILNEYRISGDYRLDWDGMDDSGNPLASGIYFCRLAMKGMSASRKMILIR